ncbi:hypothetical protein SAMN04488096_106214 [Mesonia phycicola]|uniref:DUF5683 domain-containing protein n=1 Tax=Mesonia phycicola TaxID=579105 RepID=A0A1M6FLX7_9FLAO|nr:DUF5683 domain-containing protein [Mesonia phycicola]SHI98666.1 hypothetical protein SAMN04488096_106214 [Mesonia phycicola]
MKHKIIIVLFITFSIFQLSAQEKDTLAFRTDNIAQVNENQGDFKEYNPLAPAKAAFYSAIFPGLGQIYNKRYWKLPIVYGAIGTSVAIYIYNNDQYHRYRDAYKRRLAGYNDDEFQDLLSDDSLIDAQEQFQSNKELTLLVTAAIYILNIVDANVDAHLQQFNVSNDLTLNPSFDYNQFTGEANFGLSLNIKF